MTPEEGRDAINLLVEEYRAQCLWFLRRDYFPSTDQQRRTVLDYIQRYGDRAAFVRASSLRQCLSTTSSEPSVGS